jgi:hypothetical protein
VRNRAHKLGLRKKAQEWTETDDQVLASYYEACRGRPIDLGELVRYLGRTESAIAHRASRLGLTDQYRPYSDAARMLIGGHSRERIQSNGHPRGMLGRTQTAVARAKIGQAARRYHAQASETMKGERVAKANATRVERDGTAGPEPHLTGNPFSRARRGYREDIPGIHFRSAWEANFCRYLIWLQEQGEILQWEYEPTTFRFEGVTRGPYTYLPDFRVTEKDGATIYYEVKGYMNPASRGKLKRMAKFFPDVTIIVIGKDEYRAIAKWKRLIPNWEEGDQNPTAIDV